MFMRARSEIRIGAAGMGLLLQVFLFSMLLHPCCLGLAHAGEPGASVAPLAESSSTGAHAGHGAPRDEAQHADAGHESPSGSHSHENGDDGCGGACGLCCQSVGDVALPGVPVAMDVVQESGVSSRPVAPRSVRLSAPSYLLPFANGPPLSASFLT